MKYLISHVSHASYKIKIPHHAHEWSLCSDCDVVFCKTCKKEWKGDGKESIVKYNIPEYNEIP
ncbi:MAG: hypothetical protein AABY22_09580, partial [Nanoarchaeota archaeon]